MRTKYSVVKVIRNKLMNETVASACLDTNSSLAVREYIERAKNDYPVGCGCSAKITVSMDQGLGQDYKLIETVMINE